VVAATLITIFLANSLSSILHTVHNWRRDRKLWQPQPYWVLRTLNPVNNNNPAANSFAFQTVYYSQGWIRFSEWENQIWLRHFWVLDSRPGSPTFGLSAPARQVRAHYNAVLAGDPNPPSIHWRVKFLGLDGGGVV